MLGNGHISKLAIVGISTAARLLGTLALFALLARATGPEDFGVFSYWYAFGVLVGTITDYGFAQQLLRNLAGNTLDFAANEVKQLGKAKLWLVIGCTVIAIAIALRTSGSIDEYAISIMLILSGVLGSFYEFYAMVLRARQSYRLESRLSMANSLGGSVLAGVLGYQTQSIVIAAGALVLIKLISALLAYRTVFREVLPAVSEVDFQKESVWVVLKRGFPYAFDNVATQMFGNLDAISSKHLLSGGGAGVYLSGTRLVQAALSGLPVIASVFLPALMSGEAAKVGRTQRFMYLLAIGVGALVFSLFFLLKDVLPSFIFGAAFSALGVLMPWFGLFIFFRYCAAAPGISLTAQGAQKTRSVITASSVVLTLLALATIYKFSGNITSLQLCQSMVLGACIQCVGYVVSLRLSKQRKK
jgi:O-antigen/teichoic acid export membrane protein